MPLSLNKHVCPTNQKCAGQKCLSHKPKMCWPVEPAEPVPWQNNYENLSSDCSLHWKKVHAEATLGVHLHFTLIFLPMWDPKYIHLPSYANYFAIADAKYYA
jgi:hypothetical protein